MSNDYTRTGETRKNALSIACHWMLIKLTQYLILKSHSVENLTVDACHYDAYKLHEALFGSTSDLWQLFPKHFLPLSVYPSFYDFVCFGPIVVETKE